MEMMKKVKRKRVSGKDHSLLVVSSALLFQHDLHLFRERNAQPSFILIVHPSQELVYAAFCDLVLLSRNKLLTLQIYETSKT